MSTQDLLIPVRRCTRRSGAFRWPDRPVLATPRNVDLLPLGQLRSELTRECGVRPRVQRSAFGEAALRIHRRRNENGPEAYELVIAPEGVEITAGGNPGAYYAVQTLRELARVHGREWPACRITDWPDFPRRGIYHDCARGKVPTLDTLKDLVERLAQWKINELQLYIENTFRFRGHPKIGRGYSPLTAEEILDLQEHCNLHHVRLVGSLASFGHMEKILMLPEYQHLGEMPGFRGKPGGTTLCPSDPGSIRLMEELYQEFMPLFEADDFNVCCDETWELGRGRSKRRAARVGVGKVYLDFLVKLYHLCKKHDKRMNAWADIVLQHPELLDELPRDVVMLNWDYGADGKRIPRTGEIAEAGLPLVVCPGTSGWNTHGTRLDNAIVNVRRFAAQGRKHGAEGLLNTDWGDGGHRNFLGVSLHGFAHGGAHSWHGRGVDDDGFTDRFAMHVFGERTGKLAEAIRTLGRTYLTCGGTYWNWSNLNYTIFTPLAGRKDEQDRTDETDREGLETIIRQLSSPKLWPPAPRRLPSFERIALQEYEVAAQMDLLGARRALVAKDIREGEAISKDRLRQLIDETRRVAGKFERLWLTRNKPSRLKDNLKRFEQAEIDARKHMKKA